MSGRRRLPMNRAATRKQIPISSLRRAAVVRQNRRELAKATKPMLAKGP